MRLAFQSQPVESRPDVLYYVALTGFMKHCLQLLPPMYTHLLSHRSSAGSS